MEEVPEVSDELHEEEPEESELEATSEEIDDDNTGNASDAGADDPLERYRTLLKVGVPRPAVEGRMLKDGVNPAELDGPVKDKAIGIDLALKPAANEVAVATTMRRRWHWSEVPEADRAPPPPNGSVWTLAPNGEDARQRVSARSMAHIQALFVKEIDNPMESSERESVVSATSNAEAVSATQHAPQPGKSDKMRVMTGAKGMNLEFTVNRLSHPYAKVAADINLLTAMYLRGTDIRTILAMWPSMAEQIALDKYSGDFNLLGRCEQFLVTIRAIPMAKEKLQCLLLKLELSSRVEDLTQTVKLVTRALNQVCSSTKFANVLRLLREFGNLANEEFVANYRARFSLESLLKMEHTKAFDKKTTIFDGFLYVLRTEEGGNLANFYDEINLVMQCKGVSVGGLVSEMNQLREGYELVKLVAVASAKSPDESAKLALKAFNQFADEIDDKLRGIQATFDEMEASERNFVSWFEENPNVPLDRHLKAIAQFASDVKDRFAVLNWPASRI